MPTTRRGRSRLRRVWRSSASKCTTWPKPLAWERSSGTTSRRRSLSQMPARRERHFAGKARAFNAGRARLESLDYDAIGSLDADLSFDKHYFSYLLDKLREDASLGLVGTPFKDTADASTYDYRFVSID